MSFVKHFVRRVVAPVVSVTKKSNFSTTAAAFVPRVQKPAPDFAATAVVNGEFNQLKLADFSGKYVVLVFYPLDFTFVCPTELIAYSERAKDFASIDCQLIIRKKCHRIMMNGILRHMSVNDLPVGRSVEETLRLCVLLIGIQKQTQIQSNQAHRRVKNTSRKLINYNDLVYTA
ncbi:unnamed protein product [Leptidea sinapis]|uniref:thioredoxin-dependent peroxiredoxin n=1 Tax=Leptidea sinapis TaxID=189913 RepID=A0A5E4QTJ4_9NEOP|nr:unnamed protein product [Leptidea sinapis]